MPVHGVSHNAHRTKFCKRALSLGLSDHYDSNLIDKECQGSAFRDALTREELCFSPEAGKLHFFLMGEHLVAWSVAPREFCMRT